MSWCDIAMHRRTGSRYRIGWMAPLLAVVASGCFQPLYGPTASGTTTVQDEMQSVVVDPIPERLGHYLGNELIFAFNGTGTPGPKKYRLLVTPQERVATPLVDTVTGRASAATVFIDAEFRLLPYAGGDPIVKGVAYSSATYDRTSNPYANVRAARDAEVRNARVLSDQIRTRVAAALATAS
jgi:LPS-assembly lipoprotein